MTMQSENAKSESDNSVFNAQYQKHFEKSVEDAQYLLMYASSNCPNDIKRSTLETLITARLRVENNQEASAKEEADFWLAYQELWKLVQPVTAESVRANMPFETGPDAKRAEKGSTSKARGSVSRYIGFTVFVLIVLLIMQIYWVFGNQLTARAAELAKEEADLTAQLAKNEEESDKLELRYKQSEIDSGKFNGSTYNFYNTPEWQRDILEYDNTKAQLETKLELNKSQVAQNSAITDVWKGPWGWLIEKDDEKTPPHNDKYAPLFDDIESKLTQVQAALNSDPTGKNEAERQSSDVEAQKASIDSQLNRLFEEYSTYDAQEHYIQVSISGNLTNSLNADLNQAESDKANIQTQITDITEQLTTLTTDPDADPQKKSELDVQLAGLNSQLLDVQSNIDRITAELNRAPADGTVADNQDELNVQLTEVRAAKTAVLAQIQGLQFQAQYLVVDKQAIADQFVAQLKQRQAELEDEKNALVRKELADNNREKSQQIQLAGQFVLVVLQSYLLPLLYGILGAGTSILRTLSKQINSVTFSDAAGIQHLLRISLGALSGIMVGWFSFLLPDESTSFLGSVSPLAIAFLVGYNIELFFSTMDIALNKVNEARQRSTPATASTDQSTPPPAPVENVEIQEPPTGTPPAEKTGEEAG